MIDVWTADTSALPEGGLPSGVLAPDEKKRAESFPMPLEGRRYAASRFLLRTVLAGYAGRPAGRLEFVRGPGGKPELADTPSGFHFNLSHSGDAVLLAVADSEVGVDIERHRELRELDLLVEYAFAPEEIPVFRGLPGGEREGVFFRTWCLKEAVIKAWGESAALYLDRIRVIDVKPGGVRFEDLFVREGEHYRAVPLELRSGYSSAVCLRSRELPLVRIRHFSWPPND